MNEFTVTFTVVVSLIAGIAYFVIVWHSDKNQQRMDEKSAIALGLESSVSHVEANKPMNIKRHPVGQIAHDCPVCGKNYSYWQERACKAEHDWQESELKLLSREAARDEYLEQWQKAKGTIADLEYIVSELLGTADWALADEKEKLTGRVI